MHLQNDECAGSGSQLQLAFHSNAFQCGQLVVFAQCQDLTVEGHSAAAQTVFTGQDISSACLGQFQGGGLGLGVINDQVDDTVLAVLTGVGIDMRTLTDSLTGSVNSLSHQTVPQQNCEVVGTGHESAVLQEAVVRGSQGVVEDDTVGNGRELTQLIQSSGNICIGGCPGVAAAAGIAGLGEIPIAEDIEGLLLEMKGANI